MRTNTFITDLWNKGGPYIGDARPHGRVTVQLPWSDLSGAHKYDFLRTTYTTGTGHTYTSNPHQYLDPRPPPLPPADDGDPPY